MEFLREFHGPNAGYVLELYERYRQDPDSVDAATRRLFERWSPPDVTEFAADGGAPVAPSAAVTGSAAEKIMGAVNLAQMIREFGHLAARLDPLGSEPPGDPGLTLEAHGVSEEDLRQLPATLVGGPIAERAANALEAIQELREIYCSHMGYDYEHVRIHEEREWLREAAESRRYRPSTEPRYAVALLERLTQVELFEQFLQRTFPTKYRFSIEGLDMMVPMLDELIVSSAEHGVSTGLIAMAHRGRLNVLAHIMHKPYEQILAEFKDPLELQEIQEAIGWTTGDVKYHAGTRRVIEGGQRGGSLVLTMPPNPSHLEAVNPVLMGMARASGERVDRVGRAEFNPALTLQILIHGDAAFPGQGVVAETLNLSRLPGYWVGGTVHIIANNQLGFTTLPKDGRSTLYASDLAKGFKIPILHVNADDPEACIEATCIAHAYQQEFEKDLLIDLVGYRRYGHNELDEPGFTQPMMYRKVRSHPTVRKLWMDTLVERGAIRAEAAEAMVEEYTRRLQETHDALADKVERRADELIAPQPEPPPPGEAKRTKTSVSVKRLKAINESLKQFPEGFKFYSSRLENTIRNRREALGAGNKAAIDWATAEELAFATILEEGIPIRLTGQDSERGTFSHRHAVLHDAETGETFVPLQSLAQAKASFDIHDSPLSEAAAIGFEYGYNVQASDRLVIWEAQYGDFINSGQVMMDEFVTSAREKWNQTPSLVMLLPHGWEGAGPDHSSARLERWLKLAAKTNLRIANCTSAAQYFHLLRRQALLLKTDPLPLLVMSPKSLLRNPAVSSTLKDLTEGGWQPVIDDDLADNGAEPEQIRRLVLCSGKLYFDLVTSEFREQHPEVALARVEQLYPLPIKELESVVNRYPDVKEIVWAQEEPKNMGAWEFMSWRLERLVERRLPVNYVGRRRSSSPAEGSLTAHRTNQAIIVEYAFRWKFDGKRHGKQDGK